MTKKLLLKKIISDLVSKAGSISGKNDQGPGIRVLNYHSITDGFDKDDSYQMTTPKSLFEEQMRYLHESGYSVVPCDNVPDMIGGKRAIPLKAVCITFDDGFKNTVKNAKPALERYNFNATIFLTTDFIGKGDTWLSWDDVVGMSKGPTFSFGAHSASHKKLAALDPGETEDEIVLPRKMLEDRLSKKVDMFAYPFGSYGSFDAAIVNAVKSEGYRCAFTTIAGQNRPGADPYVLRRTRISWFDDKNEFTKELEGSYDWYRLWQKMTRTP